MQPITVARDRQATNPFLRFLRFIFLLIRNYLIFVGLVVTAGSALLILGIENHAHDTKTATASYTRDNKATIQVDLNGVIAQREPEFTETMLSQLFGGPLPLYLPEMRAALKRAAQDERIAGLDIEIGALDASWAEISELRRMLAEFKDSGKKLHILLNDATDWLFFLASIAEHITINPATPVMIPGPVFQLTYFGDALKKIGVNLEVVRAGKYKSAFEPFVRNEPTAETLEEYAALEQHLRDYIVETVAKGRKKDKNTVAAWYKKSIFTADEAVAAGLVDAIGYGEPSPEQRKAAPERVDLSDYIDDPVTSDIREGDVADSSDGIGLIEATGEISMRSDGDSRGDGIDPARLREQILWAKDNNDIKAVVLRVSSPGGSAIASDMIWHELDLLAKEKPLVVSMGAYAASGGYYISAPARRIFAEPTTITGSIGVIGMLPSLPAFKEKYGISFHVVTQSDRRDMLNMGMSPSETDKQMVNSTIDQVYQTFIEKVALGRHMKVEDVDALAQGRVYTGIEALKLGLVDELGGMDAAFKSAKEFAGLDPSKLYSVLRYGDAEGNLSACLAKKTAGEFFKCLRHQTSSRPIGSQVGARVAAAFGQQQPLKLEVSDVAVRLQYWLHSKPAVLTIWPGYFSLTVH